MVRLGLDVGNVLSTRGDPASGGGVHKFSGSAIYRQADAGAAAFCVLFGRRYGFENMFIVSRVNNPEFERHWVRLFLLGTGMVSSEQIPETNVHLCKQASDKGTIAAQCRLTHFVDDRWDVLWFVYDRCTTLDLC